MPKLVVNTERVPIFLWLDNIEDGALAQAKNLANLPFAYKWIAIMPDAHEGYGMPIGGVMATTDGVIVPNAVGVDIGCGMIAARTNLTEIDTDTMKSIMGVARERIPLGFNHNKEKQEWEGFSRAPDIDIIQKELKSAMEQLGTLGGGNHFIEIQRGSDGFIWLMVHSGSRNFGFKTANVYHEKAKKLCDKWYSAIPDKDLSFLHIDTPEGKEYFNAMNYCLEFAAANRGLIMDRLYSAVCEETGAVIYEEIDVHHNYAALEHHYGKNVIVHRKGAIRARDGDVGIIPGSMGTPSYIVGGIGNSESFMSCSHGAGRAMGRGQAKRTLILEHEQSKMNGIIHGLRSVNELDEAPGAYKNIESVINNQCDLVSVRVRLHPLASIKA